MRRRSLSSSSSSSSSSYEPVIHAASHFNHKKRVAWVPIFMHTCGSFFYNYGAPLRAAGAPLKTLVMQSVRRFDATECDSNAICNSTKYSYILGGMYLIL